MPSLRKATVQPRRPLRENLRGRQKLKHAGNDGQSKHSSRSGSRSTAKAQADSPASEQQPDEETEEAAKDDRFYHVW